MYFPKQHYESTVPEKSGINRFSASHDIDLFSPIAMRRQFTVAALWLTSKLAEGRNSVDQKLIVSGATSLNRWREFNEHGQGAKSWHPLLSSFLGQSEKQLIASLELDRKQDLNVLYQVCIFRVDRKNKMTALASDWLRHVWLLFWTYFNEALQEANSR